MSSQYTIPDLLVTWPWQRILNPALAEVKDDSNAWVKSHTLFDEAQLQKFNACDFSTWHSSFSSSILAHRYFSDLLAALVALQQDKGWFILTALNPWYMLLILVCIKKFRTSPNHLWFDEFLFRFRRIHGRCKQTEASKTSNDVMDDLRRRDVSVQSPHGKITTMAQEWVINL